MRMVKRSTFWAVISIVTVATAAWAKDLPAWVTRGSCGYNNNGSRAFYGVGSASGIKNPALLRSTADNRARAELGKVFEVFSASLMKDYMASSGEQNVQQAVKTLSSLSLEGVEVRDRYVDGDGTMYALAVLDMDTVAAAVKKAKAEGIVKSEVAPVTLDDMFDKNGQKAEAPKPVVASGTESGGGKAPKASTSDTKQQKGGRPGWIDGEDPRFPLRVYLCAVGYGPKREIAESGAYAALAKVFVVHVESASQDFMGAYAKTGAPSLEVQSSATLTKTSTEKLLSGVRIPEIWQDAKDNTLYALSCLEREKNAKILRDQIEGYDKKAESALKRAEGADAQSRLKELSRALDALAIREAMNNELRIIDFDGVGVPSPYAPADVAAALEETQSEMRVGVMADGPYADEFRSTIVESLTSQGYKIEEIEGDDTSGFDVLVRAKIKMQDEGEGSGGASHLVFGRGIVMVDVKNVKQNKVIGSLKEERKEGGRNYETVGRRIVIQLSKKLAGPVGKKIDDAMKGRH
jgi:hypothetical protein